MNPTIATIIVALIASSPGILALWTQYKKEKAAAKKIEAEEETEEANAAEKIKTAALEMMGIYKKEFDELKEKISKLEQKVEQLEKLLKKELNDKRSIIKGAWVLHDQVVQLNGTPSYVPPVIQNEE